MKAICLNAKDLSYFYYSDNVQIPAFKKFVIYNVKRQLDIESRMNIEKGWLIEDELSKQNGEDWLIISNWEFKQYFQIIDEQ